LGNTGEGLSAEGFLRALGATADFPVASDPRVLVVDDDPAIRASVVRLIARPGRTVVEAGTGRDAIRALERADRPFDLGVFDVRLPDMTGLDLVRYAQAEGRAFPVILVSGDDSIDSAIQALRLGATEFIRKPYEPAQLLRSIDNALNAARLERENRWMRTQLEQSERLHRYIVEHSPDLIYMLDEAGTFRYVNDAFTRLLGYTRAELMGTHFSRIVHEEDAGKALDTLPAGERNIGGSENLELRLRRARVSADHARGVASGGVRDAARDAGFVTVVLRVMRIYAAEPVRPLAEPRCIGVYGVARDITERKRAEETVVFHAFHDSLTGLPNRTLFRDRLDLAVAQGRRTGKRVAVLFIDLDRFKAVNDTYGHVLGDQLLRQVAQRLRNCLRQGDTLSRIGGDEFTAVIPGIRGPGDAETVARKMLAALAEPFDLGDADFLTTVSVGISMYPEHGAGPDELIRNADLAMYHVKRRGKNGFVFFEESMAASAGADIGLENDLRRGLRNDEFEVLFQPVFDVRSRAVDRVEALVRWRHPQEGVLDPSRFIHVAEQTGVMHELSLLVLEKSCRQLGRWRGDGLPGLGVAVNVSASEFERRDFVAGVLGALQRHALPPESLELEITENVLIEDIDAAVDRIRRLRAYGIRISIDDFGIRYSSLGYLQRLPVNTIKIDQSFVRELGGAHPSNPIVPAIVQIARGFGFDLIAEGVEREDHLQSLATLGCHRMQGFLFRRPASAAALTGYLMNHRTVQ
jgi:diguanylate cyclase (GGDEF)-like protein